MTDQESAPVEINDAADLAEIENLMNGAVLAEEVDKPPPAKRAKASVPAAEAEDADDGDDEVDLAKLAEKHLTEEDEDDGDDSPTIGGSLYKRLLEEKKQEFDSTVEEYKGKISELEKRAALADVSMENLREMAMSGKFSKEELIEIAADLFYIAEPDRADPDTKVGLERKKSAIEQRKYQASLKAKEEEMEAARAEAEREIRVQKMEVSYARDIAKSLDDYPHIASAFDGDVDAITAEILRYATAVAASLPEDIPPEKIPDLSAGNILKLFESVAEKKHKQLQTNSRLKSKKSAPRVPVKAEAVDPEEDDIATIERLMGAR